MGIAELPITIGRPAALGASTLCEAFQITAAERPDQVALRSFGSGTAITFAEYAQRVRAIAAGLHALGVRRGDTVGIMLVNRPEFHVADMAAIHLGATPFSIYNTSSPKVEYPRHFRRAADHPGRTCDLLPAVGAHRRSGERSLFLLYLLRHGGDIGGRHRGHRRRAGAGPPDDLGGRPAGVGEDHGRSSGRRGHRPGCDA